MESVIEGGWQSDLGSADCIHTLELVIQGRWLGSCPRSCVVEVKVKLRALRMRNPRHLVGMELGKLDKSKGRPAVRIVPCAVLSCGYQDVPRHKLQPGVG